MSRRVLKRTRLVVASSDASAAGTLCNGPLHELIGCVSRFRVDVLRAPLEPAPLSVDAASEDFTSPLFLQIAEPSALMSHDVTFEVSQPWCHPFRLVRLAARLPVVYESLESTDWRAAIESFINNMRLSATLDIPPIAAELLACTNSMRLEPVVRVSSDGPRHARCVLIEIPVPAGITLHPAAAISLSLSIAGSHTTLRIPAAGHIHSATCNHKRGPKGAVSEAADAGDVAALEAARAAGGSTEETDWVRRHWNRTPYPVAVLLHTATHFSQGDTALIYASSRGHAEAVRILLAAGADVNAKGQVSLE